MFGFGKNKKSQRANQSDKRQKKPKELQAGCAVGGIGKKSESRRIREEALANARVARETIGEDTIQKIAAAMAKKENNPMALAQKQLASADADRVADEILYMLDRK